MASKIPTVVAYATRAAAARRSAGADAESAPDLRRNQLQRSAAPEASAAAAGRRTRTATSGRTTISKRSIPRTRSTTRAERSFAAFTEDQLWSGAPASLCSSAPQGDPVVVYDWLADRFVLTHFAFASVNGPFFQCIAASKTGDPVAGGWWLYAVRMDPGGAGMPPVGDINDYGKIRALARLPVHRGERIHAEQRLRRRDVRIVQPRRSLQWSAADVLARLSAAVDQRFHADTEQQPGQGRERGAAGNAQLFRLRIRRRRGIRGSQVRCRRKLRRWRYARRADDRQPGAVHVPAGRDRSATEHVAKIGHDRRSHHAKSPVSKNRRLRIAVGRASGRKQPRALSRCNGRSSTSPAV